MDVDAALDRHAQRLGVQGPPCQQIPPGVTEVDLADPVRGPGRDQVAGALGT
ncbi:hypothetical protein ACQ4WX_39125 [Streptomyces lasalocidi]